MRGPAAALAMLLPGAAFACALPPSVILTLPTGMYMTGAAITVALTALMGGLADRLPVLQPRVVLERRILLPVQVTSYFSFVAFLGLVLVGLTGARDPMHNLMTLVFWTGIWIALPLASMLLGNLWRPINPWTAPVRIARRLLGREKGIGLDRLGHLPAVAGYGGFVWFMIVSLRPDDPAVLATVALIYWGVIFALAVAEGEEWLHKGEFLTVFLGYVAKIAPVWLVIDAGRARLCAGWPGTQILGMAPLTPSAIAFVTLALAGLTFDGIVETFWWMAIIGENPLEFTGRSAVMGVNTAGLLAAWALTAATILGALWLGARLSRGAGRAVRSAAGKAETETETETETRGGAVKRATGGFAIGPVMLSFLAIAAGYHAAHYLVTLLTAGQYTLAALNDPLFRGDALLGLPPFYVSFGFLTDQRVITLIYAGQFAAILGAHMLAVLLALHLSATGGASVASRDGTSGASTGKASRDSTVRAVAHLPLTVLMVGYTVMGLWLLSTAKGV